jgi:uncharacterized protein (TIGR00730 family)
VPRMKRVCVFAGSSPGHRPGYRSAAEALGRALATRGIGVVFGGGRVGLMGALADAALGAAGRVIGVIPAALEAKELAHSGLTELRVVTSMHERKAMMADLSDGFIALPGGWGTLDELFEILTWGQLGLHQKPCGLLNVDGYFDRLLSFMQHAIEERFVRAENGSMLSVATEPDALLDAMAGYAPLPVEKWIDREAT